MFIPGAETGFGGVINVVRTFYLFAKARVAAIQIEDQEFPKRCGHLERKKIVPHQEFKKGEKQHYRDTLHPYFT